MLQYNFTEQVGLELQSVGTRFEFRSGHSCPDRFFCVFQQSLQENSAMVPLLGNGHLPLIYQACQLMRYSLEAASGVVKQQIKHWQFLFGKDFLFERSFRVLHRRHVIVYLYTAFHAECVYLLCIMALGTRKANKHFRMAVINTCTKVFFSSTLWQYMFSRSRTTQRWCHFHLTGTDGGHVFYWLV
jgi:hypothetical protein